MENLTVKEALPGWDKPEIDDSLVLERESPQPFDLAPLDSRIRKIIEGFCQLHDQAIKELAQSIAKELKPRQIKIEEIEKSIKARLYELSNDDMFVSMS